MVDEIIECNRKNYWALPTKDVEDQATVFVMRGMLNDRVTKLESGINSEDDLEEGERLIGGKMFKDVGRSNGKERVKGRTVGKKVRAVVGGMSKGAGNIRILYGSEVTISPKVV